MKEITRQFGGTLIAVLVAGMLILLIMNGVQYGSDTGFLSLAGEPVKQENALSTATAGEVFCRYWREK